MDINTLIQELLDSGMLENMELGVTILNSEKASKEQQRVYIDKFVEDYTTGKVDFFSEEQKTMFENWIKLYKQFEKEDVINRVKKIT